MAHLFKRGKRYYLKYSVSGKQKEITLRTICNNPIDVAWFVPWHLTDSSCSNRLQKQLLDRLLQTGTPYVLATKRRPYSMPSRWHR